MSMILLAVEDADRDSPIRDLLTAEGWWVTTVGSQEEALRAAADHAPQLLIIDRTLAQSGDLLQTFGRHEGGPGILVLVDEVASGAVDGADGTLARDQDTAEVLDIVRRSLEAPRPASEDLAIESPVLSEGERLTASDLFGDILEDLGAGVAAVKVEDVPHDEAGSVVESGQEPAVEDAARPRVESEDPGDDLEAEVTTGPPAEVADPIAASDVDFDEAVEVPGTGEGLSIDDVLAVHEPAAESAAEETPEAAKQDDPAVEEGESVGPYRLLELLEFGDLTERWLAERSDRGGEKLVLERIRHELLDRADVRQAFLDGYSEAAGWDHPNVLSVVDLGRDGEVDYVATEYHHGHSLREVLDRVRRMEARMPLGIGLLVAERIAAALESLATGPAASSHGWLVPGSIWLTDDGQVLLREFSSGRLESSQDPPRSDWREHRFLAPETWSGQGGVRADLYSLGALLYEMVSGQPVHAGADLESLIEAIRTQDVVSAEKVDPTIPTEIDAWITRLLRRSPEERPQGVTEITGKIDLALQALPARPANKVLSVYLKQLFAARIPEPGPQSPLADVEMPSPEDLIGDERAAAPDRPWTRFWILVALGVLLASLYGWWILSGRDREQAGEPPDTMPATETAEPVAAPQTLERSTDLVATDEVPVAVEADSVDVEALVADEFARRERERQERLPSSPTDEATEAAPATAEDDGSPSSAATPGRPLR